jgi:transposase-like protein
MVFTQHYCATCGSEHIRRNGHLAGHARYQCKACGHQARFEPAAVAKAAQYARVDALLVERNSQRSIARATGVARVTIAKRLKKSGDAITRLAPVTPEKGPTPRVGSAGGG